MKLGLIARADERGIGVQTREFFKAMRPEKTMVVMMNDPLFPEDPGHFRGKGVTFVNSDMRTRALPEAQVRDFLAGLDVVFAVETVYDWRLLNWAMQTGVKTIIQGNPEFSVHHAHPEYASPDLWCWPTDWLLDDVRIPKGPVVPVPCVDREPSTPPADEGPLRILHPAGNPAIGDRNGTLTFIESLVSLHQQVHVTIVAQNGSLPQDIRTPRNVTVDVRLNGVKDRWSMYENQHLVVIPRRYGGLCLPALEAMASGCAILMPDCSPNRTWPGPRVPARKGKLQRTPLGATPTYNLHPMDLSQAIDGLARHRETLADEMETAAAWAYDHSWMNLKDRVYVPLLESAL